jgi:hypothetical protein
MKSTRICWQTAHGEDKIITEYRSPCPGHAHGYRLEVRIHLPLEALTHDSPHLLQPGFCSDKLRPQPSTKKRPAQAFHEQHRQEVRLDTAWELPDGQSDGRRRESAI